MAQDEEERSDELLERALTRRDLLRMGGGAVGAISLAALIAACGGGGGGGGGGTAAATTSPATAASSTPTETVQAGGGKEVDTMAWALNAEPISMDYPFAYDFNTNVVVTNITEPLLRFGPSGELQPNLATAWQLKDPKTMVITLRSGVKFHDGTTMTADDVAFSMSRHLLKDINGNGPSYLSTYYARVQDVKATGPLEVTVYLSRPDAYFTYALATMAGAVGSKAFIEAKGKAVGTPAVGAIGTGPYKYTSWTKGQQVVIDRFDDYWNTQAPLKVKEFVAKILTDEATINAALQTGEIDGVWGNDTSGKSAKLAESFGNVKVYTGPSYGIHYLAMNTQKPPFNDARVRQALSMAIDKAGLLAATWGGLGQTVKSPATPAMWTFEKDTFQKAYDELPSFGLDLEKAQSLIKQAGATGAKGDILNSLPYDSEQAIAVQAAAKQIGLDLTPRKVEYTEKISEELSGKPTRQYSTSCTQWASDFPDPAGQLDVLYNSMNLVTNNTVYKNPQVDDLLNRQRDSTDPAERANLLIQAQAMIVQDQPTAIFYSPYTFMILNKRLGGYQIRPTWYWDPFVADFSGT